jgi:hypothetical protein
VFRWDIEIVAALLCGTVGIRSTELDVGSRTTIVNLTALNRRKVTVIPTRYLADAAATLRGLVGTLGIPTPPSLRVYRTIHLCRPLISARDMGRAVVGDGMHYHTIRELADGRYISVRLSFCMFP